MVPLYRIPDTGMSFRSRVSAVGAEFRRVLLPAVRAEPGPVFRFGAGGSAFSAELAFILRATIRADPGCRLGFRLGF